MPSHFDDIVTPYLMGDPTTVVLGYSGGVDSHVLLHLMAQCQSRFPQHQFKAVYIDHGLSPNAKQWQRHCHDQCMLLDIEFDSVSVDVKRSGGESLEASARQARYYALSGFLPSGGILLLGQHADDQVETFMLQLKRGSGPKGLSSMAQDKTLQNGIRIVRPLLRVARKDIENYAQQANLSWIEDESNEDLSYDRNFLRHKIIPLLTERWPEMNIAVARSAALCAEQQTLLDEVVIERLANVEDEQQRLSVEKLKRYAQAWQHQIVRAWLIKREAPLPSLAILQQLSTILWAVQDAEPLLNWQGHQIRRFKGKLYLTKATESPQNHTFNLSMGNSHCIDSGSASFEIKRTPTNNKTTWTPTDTNRTPIKENEGDYCEISIHYDGFAKRFRPFDAKHSKPLKQWFKEWQVPVWERNAIAQVMVGDEVVALIWNSEVIPSVNLPQCPIDIVRPDLTV